MSVNPIYINAEKALMKVLVAIPCYRCAVQIHRVLEEFDGELLKRVNEVAIFDNCSPDNTLEEAKRAAAALAKKYPGACSIRVFKNENNFGLGGTHKAAFLYAERIGFDYVAILHGDNQAVTGELKELIDIAEQDQSLDAVLGARFMRDSRRVGYSLIRTLGNLALNFVYCLTTLRPTYDLGSGLNLFKVTALKDHKYLSFSDGFSFNIDLLLDYRSRHAKIRFHPITWREEDQISNAKALRVGLTALKSVLKWRLGWRPAPNVNGYTYLTNAVSCDEQAS
jgi:glycosyltransferase involved in cell wall biosynthesis